jgi:hypothetical protein
LLIAGACTLLQHFIGLSCCPVKCTLYVLDLGNFIYKVLIYEESQNVLTNSPVLLGYFFKKGVMAASLGLLRQNPEKRPSLARQNLRSESRKTAKSSWPEPQIRDQKDSQSNSPEPQVRIQKNSQV